MSSISLFFLGLAVLLSTATQFRFGVFGVGEIAGALGVCGLLVSTQRIPSIAVKYLFGVAAIAAGLVFGSLVSVLLFDAEFRALDLWAMLYAQLVAFAILVLGLKAGRVGVAVVAALIAFPVMQLCLLALSLVGYVAFPVWYSGDEDLAATVPFVSRFMGWSLNPNQLGISLSALPFWLLFFFGSSSRFVVRMTIGLAIACCIACGLLINSNTVFLGWILGAFILLSKFSWWSLRATPVALPAILLGVSAVLVLGANALPTLLEKGPDSDFNGRLPIWLSSLESWASSPLFGLGPGPHASDGFSQVGTAESHMLLLDLLTQGGVVAASAMIYLFWMSWRAALRSGNAPAIAGTLALFVEALAHNTQRHPIFWVYLVLPLLLWGHLQTVRQSVRSLIESPR